MNKNDKYNEKFEDKYQKLRAQVDVENLDFTRVKQISKTTEKITQIVLWIISIVGIVAFIFVFIYIIFIWKNMQGKI